MKQERMERDSSQIDHANLGALKTCHQKRKCPVFKSKSQYTFYSFFPFPLYGFFLNFNSLFFYDKLASMSKKNSYDLKLLKNNNNQSLISVDFIRHEYERS